MVILKAAVSARVGRYPGRVRLCLTETPEGWTYRVEEVTGEPFLLTWRTRTPESAGRKLLDVYAPSAWDLEVLESRDGESPGSRGEGRGA
jgi:hypothetical protein